MVEPTGQLETEVMIDGENGFLHSFGDVDAVARSIALLADSPDEASRMGVAGRQRAESLFTAGQIVPQYEALYGRILRRTFQTA